MKCSIPHSARLDTAYSFGHPNTARTHRQTSSVGAPWWLGLEVLLSNTCRAARNFLPLSLPLVKFLTSKRAGVAQGVGRGYSWDGWPQLTRGILHTIQQHDQHIALGEEGRSGRCSEWCHLASQPSVTCYGAQIYWRCMNICLTMRSGESIPWFCFAYVHGFWFTYQTVFVSIKEFSNFCPFYSLPHWERTWASNCMGLNCPMNAGYELLYNKFRVFYCLP